MPEHKLSIVIPMYNEADNVEPLLARIHQAMENYSQPWEVVLVDDGSRDGSLRALWAGAVQRHELKVVSFRRNFGQTAATMAAIDHSRGGIIVALDADLQNDPADIPNLLAKVEEGFDVVSGWRHERKDAPVRRTFISRIANAIISRISGVKLRDYGCTLKIYRRDVMQGVRLYGEMHRFIPIYASWMGAKVVEIPVSHRPRRAGKSNYGLERIIKVILDLMVVKFLDRHFVKPMYVFGGFGLICLAVSVLSAAYMFFLKFVEGVSMILTPLPLLTTLTFLLGVMSFLLGLLAEMLVRTYFESQNRTAYSVRERINFPEKD
jgi:dolichol-phosphate mannosyltransferase